MKVKQFEGRNGTVKNQFIIEDDKGTYFQSYASVICRKPKGYPTFPTDNPNMKIELDKETWDYSKTTGKYRNQFLGETKAETLKKIKSGEYILTNLNQ